MQAIILAAGMGKRLKELTQNETKGMVKFLGRPIIFRLISQLEKFNLSKIIVVVGYKHKSLIESLRSEYNHINFEFIFNPIYNKTNNVYSLYLAKKYFDEDTILFESDLILDDSLIERVVKSKKKDIVLASKFKPWMDGTVISIDNLNKVKGFVSKEIIDYSKTEKVYKTVNVYKFSSKFLTTKYLPFLDAYIKSVSTNSYYEDVLKAISNLSHVNLYALVTKPNEKWYEIDDKFDLINSEAVFSEDQEKSKNLHSRFGGYWRFDNLIDFCYLVNPYFPHKRFNALIKNDFDKLISHYPSGQKTLCTLASRNFDVSEKYLAVGNGAAELIKEYAKNFSNQNVGVIIPTFEDYLERFKESNLKTFKFDELFSYGEEDIKRILQDLDLLVIVNPDNPSGNFIDKKSMIQILSKAKNSNTEILLDESFVDFTDSKRRFTFFDEKILDKFKNLKVLKSISKSYGVPGLRLGVISTSDHNMIDKIRQGLPLWNINSFAEYFLEHLPKFSKQFKLAQESHLRSKNKFYKQLLKLNCLSPLPSQSNYFLCKVKPPQSSKSLSNILLTEYNILIKDCSSKVGFDGEQFIRIAIRNSKDNNYLIKALKEVEKRK